SRVGFSRSLIAADDRRRGASIWARPAMATCWKSMGWAPVANTEPYRVAPSTPRRMALPERAGAVAPARPAPEAGGASDPGAQRPQRQAAKRWLPPVGAATGWM